VGEWGRRGGVLGVGDKGGGRWKKGVMAGGEIGGGFGGGKNEEILLGGGRWEKMEKKIK